MDGQMPYFTTLYFFQLCFKTTADGSGYCKIIFVDSFITAAILSVCNHYQETLIKNYQLSNKMQSFLLLASKDLVSIVTQPIAS